MNRFYVLRRNDLEELISDLNRYLDTLARPELQFLSDFTWELRQVDRDDEQAIAALFQQLPKLPKLAWNGKYASHDKLAYDSLQREFVLFVNHKLPKWTHSPRLKALALNAYDSSWHRSALSEQLSSDLSLTIDESFTDFMEDCSDDPVVPERLLQALNSFYEFLENDVETELERFRAALDSFTVAVLLEDPV